MGKRYDCITVTEWDDTFGKMEEEKDGEYVRYEDYKALEDRLKEIESRA